MAPWYIRARLRSLLRTRTAGHKFTARTSDRDAETDRSRAESILGAIDAALIGAQTEYAGLNHRMDEVLALTTARLGDTTDEQPNQMADDVQTEQLFEAELLNGQRRLDDINAAIIHYKLLKAALLSGLPSVKAAA